VACRRGALFELPLSEQPSTAPGEIIVSTELPRPERDRGFESGPLQQAVCLSGERRDCTGKAPQFGGILRVAGDVRRDVHATNRASFALSL
jgi:hypothetical protein